MHVARFNAVRRSARHAIARLPAFAEDDARLLRLIGSFAQLAADGERTPAHLTKMLDRLAIEESADPDRADMWTVWWLGCYRRRFLQGIARADHPAQPTLR